MPNMSEAQYRAKTEDYSRRLFRDPKVDLDIACGFYDWSRGELADMEREKLQVEEMKKAAGQGQLGLRNRLKNLVTLILTQTSVREKLQ